MTALSNDIVDGSAPTVTPLARFFTAMLLIAPLTYLVADSLYAVRGWDDPTAGVIHVLGAIGYGFVALAVASRLPADSRLSFAIIVIGVIGMAGNVAYGFDTIHTSLGDVPLVDQHGAANLIKPLGLFFPASLAVIAAALARLRLRQQAILVAVAAIAWPVAHIGNFGAVAVPVNVALTVAIGSIAWPQRR
ncbi:MAG: hypothetical protein JWM34_334 [Ilumatobacteraceae bacterium]|nr:hypothetical protein [Ilumatobacteraceae bacterium]